MERNYISNPRIENPSHINVQELFVKLLRIESDRGTRCKCGLPMRIDNSIHAGGFTNSVHSIYRVLTNEVVCESNMVGNGQHRRPRPEQKLVARWMDVIKNFNRLGIVAVDLFGGTL